MTAEKIALKNALETYGKQIDLEIKHGETTYTSANIVSFTPSHEGSLLTAIMKQAEIELDGVGGPEFAEDIKGEKLYIALTVTGAETAKKEFGTFIVKDAEYKDDTNSVIIESYDLMLLSMTPFSPAADFDRSSYEIADFGDMGTWIRSQPFTLKAGTTYTINAKFAEGVNPWAFIQRADWEANSQSDQYNTFPHTFTACDGELRIFFHTTEASIADIQYCYIYEGTEDNGEYYGEFGALPVTLGEYLQAICDRLGITLATPTFANSDVIIDEEKYDSTYTTRDVLTEIAQAAGGTIAIKDDELYVLYPTESGVTIEPSNLKTLEIGELYGPVNSVVIARTPQEDNIYFKDEAAEKICEVKIANNQLMDSHREDFIEGIYNALYGLKYYPHEIESFGIGILDICDLFTIETLDGNTYTALHLSGDVEITQGIVERTRGDAPAATETEYKAASESDRVLNKTILRVDKQEQTIQALVTNTTNRTNELTGEIEAVRKTAEQKITPGQVEILISEAVEGVDSITTSTGYTFNQDGLKVQKSGEEIENKIDHTGMYVNRDDDNVLTANHEGVEGINLKARQFLIVGENCRFEDYENNRTACFYIGG